MRVEYVVERIYGPNLYEFMIFVFHLELLVNFKRLNTVERIVERFQEAHIKQFFEYCFSFANFNIF